MCNLTNITKHGMQFHSLINISNAAMSKCRVNIILIEEIHQ